VTAAESRQQAAGDVEQAVVEAARMNGRSGWS
jgi:hypothetical protein